MKLKRSNKQNLPRSAYEEYLSSGSGIEDDIDYFATRTQPVRQAKKPARTVASHPKRSKSIKQNNHKSAPRASSSQTQHSRTGTSAPLPEEYRQKREEKEQRKKIAFARQERLFTMLAAALITLFIFGTGLLTLTGKVKQYSENENRYLAGKPTLTASTVKDGKFMEDMENYLSDQFVGRSALVKTRTAIDLLCGKKEINDVYIGKKHFLFEKQTPFDTSSVNTKIETIQAFCDAHDELRSFMAIAPNASDMLPELMPRFTAVESRQEQVNSIYRALEENLTGIDLYAALEKSEDAQSLYYRTDHHWTTKAASIAFEEIAASMELDTSDTDLQFFALTNDFQGTLASSSGLFNAKDTIYIAAPKTDISYVVTYVNENQKSSSVFVSDKLEKKNQYEVFFGGNFAQVKIETTLNSKDVLLVVKDSYANCLVPMLIPYYKSIIMIDPRYYMENIDETIANEGVTDVLWLYNTDTFLGDTSIASVFS